MANHEATPPVADRAWVRYLPSMIRRRLADRHVFQAAVENSGWLIADKLLRMGLGLLVGVWIARYLGPSSYGEMSYAASLVGLAAAVVGLGMESVVIRELVKFPEKTGEVLGTAFVLRFLSGLLFYLLVVGVVRVMRPDDPLAWTLVAIFGWSLTIGALDVIDLWFQSQVMSKYVVYAKNSGFLASVVIRILLILSEASVVAFVVANLVELGIGAVALLYVYLKKGGIIRKWKASTSVARQLLRTGWPLLLAGMLSVLCLRIDQVMLGQMGDAKELGLYAAAVRVAEIWFFIPAAIIGSVFPNIIKTREIDETEFYRRLQKLFNFLAFAGYAVAVPVTLLAPFIIKLLYGAAFAGAAPMLVLLVWSDLFMNLAMARGAYLFSMNWMWTSFWVYLVAAVSNIALNLFLIPRYGGIGAAIASCISYWLGAHAVCYLTKPLHKVGNMMTRSLLYPKFW